MIVGSLGLVLKTEGLDGLLLIGVKDKGVHGVDGVARDLHIGSNIGLI